MMLQGVYVCVLVLTLGTLIVGQAPLDAEPRLLKAGRYTLPPGVREKGIGGHVKIGIELDSSGKAKRAGLLLGPTWPCGDTPVSKLQELEDSLVALAMSFEFSLKIKRGKPVETVVSLTLDLDTLKLVPRESDSPKPEPLQSGPFKTLIGGVINGKAESLPIPNYPAAARLRGDRGAVHVQVFIDEAGKVVSASPSSGPRLLQFAAREAACEAKFSPTLLSGQPIKVTGVITYNFQ